MFCFEDLEYNLADRMKSVAILILAVLLIVLHAGDGQELTQTGMELPAEDTIQSGKSQTGEQEPWEASSLAALPGLTDNPIDRYFSSYKDGAEQTADPRHWAYIYLDCWEQELNHAYELLTARSGPLAERYRGESEAGFAAFSQAESWLEAYFGEAGSAGNQKGRLSGYAMESQDVSSEETLAVNRIFAQTQLIRLQVLRMYGLLEENSKEEGTSCFVFDSDQTKTALESGRYR